MTRESIEITLHEQKEEFETKKNMNVCSRAEESLINLNSNLNNMFSLRSSMSNNVFHSTFFQVPILTAFYVSLKKKWTLSSFWCKIIYY